MIAMFPYQNLTVVCRQQGENDIEQLCCVLRVLGTPDEENWPVRFEHNQTSYEYNIWVDRLFLQWKLFAILKNPNIRFTTKKTSDPQETTMLYHILKELQ